MCQLGDRIKVLLYLKFIWIKPQTQHHKKLVCNDSFKRLLLIHLTPKFDNYVFKPGSILNAPQELNFRFFFVKTPALFYQQFFRHLQSHSIWSTFLVITFIPPSCRLFVFQLQVCPTWYWSKEKTGLLVLYNDHLILFLSDQSQLIRELQIAILY